MPVSIKDIAHKAGVAPSTVSRALSNHPRISKETTRYIQKLAAEMGYVPSAAARLLVSSRSTTIGVAVNDFLNPFYVDLISNIENAILDEQYHVFVSSFHRNKKRELSLLNAFYERRLAGVVVAGSLIDKDYQSWPNRSSMPVVLINASSYPFSVAVDNFWGLRQAAAHLLELGHRRLAFITQGYSSNTEKQRIKGCRTALAEYNISADELVLIKGDGGITGGVKAVPQLLALPKRPTAVLCYNDMTAIGVINGLQQQGYNVPQDFSVVGFDDLGIASAYSPSLTTVRQPTYQLGQGAISVLRNLTAGNEDIVPQIIKPKLIIRQSTAQLKKESFTK